jgi:hypothetical protein
MKKQQTSIVESLIKPIIINFVDIRTKRQQINNKLALDSILAKDLTKHININEYKRILTEVNITENELLDKCFTDIITAKILAVGISKKSSRQGIKDEELQIKTCNIIGEKCGIIIKNLKINDYRPTKTGDIITQCETKKKTYQKNDALKSFDGKIMGKKKGWVFAKVVMGDGGHQDNVFEEAHVFCEWVIKYGEKTKLFIVLLDTNLIEKMNKLKQKYIQYPHIVIGCHVEIQQYLIDNYYYDLSNK